MRQVKVRRRRSKLKGTAAGQNFPYGQSGGFSRYIPSKGLRKKHTFRRGYYKKFQLPDKVFYYLLFILVAVVILPLVFIKGCGPESPGSYQPPPALKDVKNLWVYVKADDSTVQMELEEYTKGVVAAEMPAEFTVEALKAQAVAARTYALGRVEKLYASEKSPHPDADVCTDPGHCQAWISRAEAEKKWGKEWTLKYWSKISDAVDDTKRMAIMYDGKLINPLFHSNSGGKTDNIEEVWAVNAVPYLKSIESPGEDVSSEFSRNVSLTIKEFVSKLKKEYSKIIINEKNPLKDIKIMERSEGGRVKDIKIGSITIKGNDFRRIFKLNSTNFNITQESKDRIKITVVGNGHGVGMSQWGANCLAKEGVHWEDILKYYYKDVEIVSLDNKFSADMYIVPNDGNNIIWRWNL